MKKKTISEVMRHLNKLRNKKLSPERRSEIARRGYKAMKKALQSKV